MRPELPAEQSEDPRPVWIQLSLFPRASDGLDPAGHSGQVDLPLRLAVTRI